MLVGAFYDFNHMGLNVFDKFPQRSLISVSGKGVENFLEGLISNSLPRDTHKLAYSALLSPQGKFLFDFFIFSPEKGTFLIDIIKSCRNSFIEKLSFYQLRTELEIVLKDFNVILSKTKLEEQYSLVDPRNRELGFRNYVEKENFFEDKQTDKMIWDNKDYEKIRIINCIPEYGKELFSNETYILEANFEKIDGVNFTKGCFVGQEVTARMKHKVKLRKGLTTVCCEKENMVEQVEYGASIYSNGKEVGRLLSVIENYGIAYLRFDRILENITCNGINLKILN